MELSHFNKQSTATRGRKTLKGNIFYIFSWKLHLNEKFHPKMTIIREGFAKISVLFYNLREKACETSTSSAHLVMHLIFLLWKEHFPIHALTQLSKLFLNVVLSRNLYNFHHFADHFVTTLDMLLWFFKKFRIISFVKRKVNFE